MSTSPKWQVNWLNRHYLLTHSNSSSPICWQTRRSFWRWTQPMRDGLLCTADSHWLDPYLERSSQSFWIHDGLSLWEAASLKTIAKFGWPVLYPEWPLHSTDSNCYCHSIIYCSWLKGVQLKSNFTSITQAIALNNKFEKYSFEITATFPSRSQWVSTEWCRLPKEYHTPVVGQQSCQ